VSNRISGSFKVRCKYHTGIIIKFNKAGIEKTVSKIGSLKAIALCNLKEILDEA